MHVQAYSPAALLLMLLPVSVSVICVLKDFSTERLIGDLELISGGKKGFRRHIGRWRLLNVCPSTIVNGSTHGGKR